MLLANRRMVDFPALLRPTITLTLPSDGKNCISAPKFRYSARANPRIGLPFPMLRVMSILMIMSFRRGRRPSNKRRSYQVETRGPDIGGSPVSGVAVGQH